MPFPSSRTLRHGTAAVIGAAFLIGGAPVAAADPPNCTAADLTGVVSGVAAATSGYLYTHPDVNDFFTSLKGQPREQMHSKVKDYLQANPDVRDDLAGIRQPLADLKARCKGAPASEITEP